MASSPISLDQVKQQIGSDEFVFVSGIFNILHPGHLRLLRFAKELGKILVVGVLPDNAIASPSEMQVEEQTRLEFIEAIHWVDYAFILPTTLNVVLTELRPPYIVKGKEHANQHNLEQEITQLYGGKLIFSSGEATFSSIDQLRVEQYAVTNSLHTPALDFLNRHKTSTSALLERIKQFSNLKVCVIGDLIVDEYIECDPIGMSQEDPTIVVTPIDSTKFLGGAGIVASHVKALGAKSVFFVSSVGNDETAKYAKRKLDEYGINSKLLVDQSRPTILKQRFRAKGKTLLRMNHLRKHPINQQIEKKLLNYAKACIEECDIVLFSDFNYGLLPQSVVDELTDFVNEHGKLVVADSQSSSQLGDISRFNNMLFITPTEHEARVAMRNPTDGLVILAESLRKKSNAKNVFITLGAEGVLIQQGITTNSSESFLTDRLPALNSIAKDTAGAGDSFLATAALTMCAGGNIWEAAYLGSLAAACQVGRVGNMPIEINTLRHELSN